jgi:hypothetical protein
MGLKELNTVLAGLMAMQGFIMLAILFFREPSEAPPIGKKKASGQTLAPQSYYAAFLLFWALAWSADFFDWLIVLFYDEWRDRLWVAVMVDLAEDIFFGSAAYTLVCGARFSWNDRYLKVAYASLPALALLFIIPALFVAPRNTVWRLSFGSLDFLLFVAAMLALGVSLFRELRKSEIHLAVIVLIVFALYALLQLPTTVIGFIDPEGHHPGRLIIRVLFAISKIALFFAMVAVFASFYRANITRQLLTSIRVVSLVMAVGAELLLGYYRLSEAVLALVGARAG